MSRAEQRQAACTHLNVTRLFGAFDSQKCQMCGRGSSFGWLYRCTQDYDSFLPESDFSSAEPDPCDSTLNEEDFTSQLTQRILRGVGDGRHSEQQAQLLQAQKLRMLDNCPNATMPLHHQSTNMHCQYTTKRNTDRQGAHPLLPSAPKNTYAKPLALDCDFKCCHNCRPAYRDRAFQSLNAILAEPFKHPPEWELENRRISDASVLKSLGQPLLRPQFRRSFQTFDDLEDVTRSPSRGSSWGGDADGEICGRQDNFQRWSGFRHTVRKALGALDRSKSASTSSQQSSKSSSRESLVQISRPMLFKRHRKPADTANSIASNKSLQESLLLMLAVNTPLPHASDDSDSFDNWEVKVEDVVAVTEECVELKAPDIIMQA